MADILDDEMDSSVRPSRPSLVQVRALIEFIQKHPELTQRNVRCGFARKKVNKLWVQVSNIANSLPGTLKSTQSWMKYWADKRRSIMMKQIHIEEGKIHGSLSPIEQKIYDMSQNVPVDSRNQPRKKRNVKMEPCNGNDEESTEELFADVDESDLNQDNSRLKLTDSEERHLSIMEKFVDVMDQQSQAMAQMAQASHNQSKALERLAEAAHIQALAVDRVASTFENINSSVLDVRNAIVSIDYTMKRYYSSTQERQNSSLFA